MIKGLQFDISSEELKAHCKKRAKHYENKVAKCEKTIEKHEQKEIESYAGRMIDDHEVYLLLETVANAEEKIRLFYFIHDHITPNETYWLSRPELVSIDFI